MHSLPKFVLHLFQFGEESLADGLAQHKELAVLPDLSTDSEVESATRTALLGETFLPLFLSRVRAMTLAAV